MALTTKSLKSPGLVRFYSITEVTFSNSYTTGGEAFTAATAGLGSIDHAFGIIIAGSESSTLRPTIIKYSEEKLLLVDSATGKEMESGKDMSKVKAQIWAFGKSRAK